MGKMLKEPLFNPNLMIELLNVQRYKSPSCTSGNYSFCTYIIEQAVDIFIVYDLILIYFRTEGQ